MSAAPFESSPVSDATWPGVHRLSARRVAHHSVEGLLARVLRDAMSEDWNPVLGARRAVMHVQGDEDLLRRARLRLQEARTDRVPLVRARAVASLNLALGSLHDGDPPQA